MAHLARLPDTTPSCCALIALYVVFVARARLFWAVLHFYFRGGCLY